MPHGQSPKPSTRAAESERFPRLDETAARRLSARLRDALIARGRLRVGRAAALALAEAKKIAEGKAKAEAARLATEHLVSALRARVTAGIEAQEHLARLGYYEPPVVMSYALLAEELTSRRIYNQSGGAFNRVAVRKAIRLGTRFFAGLRDFCVEGGVEFAAATRFLDRLAETRAPRASRGAVADVVHTRAATGRRALA